MVIDLDRARREPFHWQETREVPAAALERPELDRLSEIDWQGRVTFTDPGFYLTGRLAYRQRLICTRCLKSFTEPVESGVELLLLVEERHRKRRTGEDAGEGVELEEEDLGVVILHDDRFDTDPVLLEQLQLNIPMKPLCRPDCRGLCPVCGADRNAGGCSCSERTVDPRWQDLSGLKERLTRREAERALATEKAATDEAAVNEAVANEGETPQAAAKTRGVDAD